MKYERPVLSYLERYLFGHSCLLLIQKGHICIGQHYPNFLPCSFQAAFFFLPFLYMQEKQRLLPNLLQKKHQ